MALTRARRAVAAALFSSALFSISPARGDDGDGELELVVATGTGVDAEAVRKHLRVELAEVRSPARVEIVRGGDAIRLRIVFPDGMSDERDVALRDVTSSEVARVIALVIAESARAHRPPAPAEPSRGPVTVPPPPAAPLSRERGLSFGGEAAFGVRAFDAARHLAIEPRLGGFLRHASGARIDAGAFYLRSSAKDALGSVVLDGLGGSIGASFERKLGASITARVGPRLDVGGAWARGSSSGVARGGSASELLILATGELAVRYSLGSVALLLSGDAGGVVSGIVLGADERLPLAWNGLTLGARVGLAIE